MGDCLVVSSEQWSHLMTVIGWMVLLTIACAWLAAFDLGLWEWRVRRHLRRRRLARIRAAARLQGGA